MKPSDDPLPKSFADRAMESVKDDTLTVTRAAMRPPRGRGRYGEAVFRQAGCADRGPDSRQDDATYCSA